MKEFLFLIDFYMTPLRLACRNNNIDVVKILLKEERIDVNHVCVYYFNSYEI